MYRDHGVHLELVVDTLESGILDVWQRMNCGRLKVFSSLQKYLEERRLYRRDEKDRVVRERDHLQDATRCLMIGLSYMRCEPVKRSVLLPRCHYDALARMA
jgi:hypothetical protein